MMSPGEAAYIGFHLADDEPAAAPPYLSLPMAERIHYTFAAFTVIGWWTGEDHGPDPAPAPGQ